MSILTRLILLASLAPCLLLTGCDSLAGEDSASEGPSTVCLYNFEAASVAGDFGSACADDSECAHGECMMPGDLGNITNGVFGFCTRGCDCNDASDAQITEASYDCIYPGGCFVGQSQGAWRHVAPNCDALSDCTAIDSRYTDCADTGTMTVIDGETCDYGKVCQAHP